MGVGECVSNVNHSGAPFPVLWPCAVGDRSFLRAQNGEGLSVFVTLCLTAHRASRPSTSAGSTTGRLKICDKNVMLLPPRAM